MADSLVDELGWKQYIGQETGSGTGETVLARDIRRFALAIDDPNPIYYDEDAARKSSKHDFGMSIFPRMLNKGKIFAYTFDGYWHDVGTVQVYWQTSMDLLEMNPDLTLAHSLYTHFEVERGRAEQSMIRLLGRAPTHATDPELFTGLVVACRFCGLLDASIAADRIARRGQGHRGQHECCTGDE